MPHQRPLILVASFVLLDLTIPAGASDSAQQNFQPGQVKAHPQERAGVRLDSAWDFLDGGVSRTMVTAM